MKYFLSIISLLLISFSFFYANTYSSSSSIFSNQTTTNPYDNKGWLEEWLKAVEIVKAIETKRTASQYIQDVVRFILWFLMLISVLIIIYAWFNLLTWMWDEEKAKKSKMIIIYALAWLVIIYLAGPISDFVFNILNAK